MNLAIDKKSAILIFALGLIIAMAIPVIAIQARPPHGPGSLSDYALIDSVDSPPDTGAKCGSNHAFLFFMTVTNRGSSTTPVTVQVLFKSIDGTTTDSLSFPLASGQTLSLSQSAGGDQTTDAILQVVVPAQITGWVSLMNQVKDAKPPPGSGFNGQNFCFTTTS